MDLLKWFEENSVYAPSKAERAIVRKKIAAQYPMRLRYIADDFDEVYTHIIGSEVNGFTLSTGPLGRTEHSLTSFLYFCASCL